jgi:hypothetical protein
MAFGRTTTSRYRLLPGGQAGAEERSEPTCPYCCQELELACAPARVQAGFRIERAQKAVGDHEFSMIGVCRRCRVAFEDVNTQLTSYEQIRQRVHVAIYRTRRARDLFDRRKGDVRAAMSELAEAFAWLEGKPGVRLFSAHKLHEWVTETELSESQRDCIAFVLHVHDATWDWTVRFDVVAAMERWDPAQRAVFVEWAQCPWWA